ncbi:MAG: DUF4118 domain-containing protein, partial [Pseudomonadota bacterium]
MRVASRPSASLAPVWAWVLALAAPALATGAALALDEVFSIAGLAMVYLIAVVASALTLPARQSAVCALLSVSALNFFFVPPRHSLRIDGAEYWWILSVLLALALGLGAMVARLRQRGEEAERASARAASARELAERLAAANGAERMAVDTASFFERVSGLACAVYLVQADGALVRWTDRPSGAFHERAARWVVDNGRPAGRGCVDWPELALWCAPFARRNATGAVQLLFADSKRPRDDELVHWQDLAAQAGAAIERERAAHRAREAEDVASAEAARNTLLASLSHDLRTPLAALVGSASALRAQGAAMSAPQRERLLANLEEEALDLAFMADDVLQTARLAQPQAQLRKQWESVEDILGAAVTRVRRRWPGVAVRLRCPPGLPLLEAEAGLLAQAVANLVDNAVRHGGAGVKVVVQAGRSRD